jgi:hypothetical protein
VDRLDDVLWIGTGALFLRSSGIHPTLLHQCERLSCMASHERVCVMCIRFLLQDVHRLKSPRLSDMSNRLSHSSQHVVNCFE